MGEKWLYFCNILCSRWVNAVSGNLRDVKSVLVVKWDEIGDMAAAVHVFGLLKGAYPGAKITVLCKPFVSTLIAGDPSVDEVITDVDSWVGRYDVVVELRGTWKTFWKSLRLRTMPKARVDRGWVRFLQRGKQPHEVVTNYRVIAPLLGVGGSLVSVSASTSARSVMDQADLIKRALYPTAEDKELAASWMELAGKQPYAILHTGARSELRRWPAERYAALSRWLLSEKNLLSIWVGTADEEALIDEAFVLGAAGKKWIAPEGSSLLAFYAFIGGSALYVGNESGPLQLADIAAVPLVAIYGPGVPIVFYPMSARSRVLHEVLDCNPCGQVVCIRPSDRCIDRIGLASVQLAVGEVLG